MGDALTGTTTIESANDIAFLFKNLESASSENVFAVLQDKSGRYKVIYVSTGTINASIADFKSFLGAVDINEIAKITLVHNHPSGILDPSNMDRELWYKLSDVCKALGIENTDGVIINLDSGKYTTFNQYYTSIKDKTAIKGEAAEQDVYQFDRHILYTPSNERVQLQSSEEIAGYLQKKRFERQVSCNSC